MFVVVSNTRSPGQTLTSTAVRKGEEIHLLVPCKLIGRQRAANKACPQCTNTLTWLELLGTRMLAESESAS